MRLWGIRVLIFDDDEALVREAAAALQREGGAAIHVSGAHQALATIIGVMPDLMVVAVDRPALDAGRLMRLVRTLSPEKGGRIPAVSVSALPAITEGWHGQGDLAHFQGHLVRPLDPEEFVATALVCPANGSSGGRASAIAGSGLRRCGWTAAARCAPAGRPTCGRTFGAGAGREASSVTAGSARCALAAVRTSRARRSPRRPPRAPCGGSRWSGRCSIPPPPAPVRGCHPGVPAAP